LGLGWGWVGQDDVGSCSCNGGGAYGGVAAQLTKIPAERHQIGEIEVAQDESIIR